MSSPLLLIESEPFISWQDVTLVHNSLVYIILNIKKCLSVSINQAEAKLICEVKLMCRQFWKMELPINM